MMVYQVRYDIINAQLTNLINNMFMNPALKEFWNTKADLKILKGGRSSSKSHDAAGFAIFLASRYTLKFLCMRQFQSKIKESVYALLCIKIEAFGLQADFEILKTEIIHKKTGSSFHFYGIHRSIDEIKGFEGANIGWIEEGEGLTKEQWRIIEPTLRADHAECWILYNPRLINDFIETLGRTTDSDVLVRHINYDENPFLSDTMKKKINKLKLSDYEEYQHVYLGVARRNDDNSIIKREWIETAIDAHKKLGIELGNDNRVGFDVADSGNDLCSQTLVKGITAVWADHWKAGDDELLESCTRVFNTASNNRALIRYDSIGVGASSGAKFKELNESRLEKDKYHVEVEYKKFIAGSKVINPELDYADSIDGVTNREFFENLKVQTWWSVADRFRNTFNAITKGHEFNNSELISISSDMPNLQNLITELSTPNKKFSKSGKVMVETKEQLSARGIASPNDADSFVMCYAPNEIEIVASGFDW